MRYYVRNERIVFDYLIINGGRYQDKTNAVHAMSVG